MTGQITNLHPKISRHFTLDELSTLCFQLNIDFEELAGETKQKKVQSLLEYIVRRGDEEILSNVRLRRISWRLPGRRLVDVND